MVILGLTGSIAMGKSTATLFFHRLRVPVFDADAVVHRLYASDRTLIAAIETMFPGVVKTGQVDRGLLSRHVLGDETTLARLEALVHPAVAHASRSFLAAASRRGETLAVLSVPLLFETGLDRDCDAVAVVSAPRHIQARRALLRPGMTRDRLDAILARQIPDTEKRRRADFIVLTGLGLDDHYRQIRAIAARAPVIFPRCWRPGYNI